MANQNRQSEHGQDEEMGSIAPHGPLEYGSDTGRRIRYVDEDGRPIRYIDDECRESNTSDIDTGVNDYLALERLKEEKAELLAIRRQRQTYVRRKMKLDVECEALRICLNLGRNSLPKRSQPRK